jgi:hypothetical protein
MTFKILGVTDAVSTCDCCGKKNLKKAIELENPEGDIVFYGTDCAGAALYGRKDRKNGQAAEFRARVVAKAREALPAVLAMIAEGKDLHEVSKAMVPVLGQGRNVTFGTFRDTGNKMPLRIYALGSNIAGVELLPSEY